MLMSIRCRGSVPWRRDARPRKWGCWAFYCVATTWGVTKISLSPKLDMLRYFRHGSLGARLKICTLYNVLRIGSFVGIPRNGMKQKTVSRGQACWFTRLSVELNILKKYEKIRETNNYFEKLTSSFNSVVVKKPDPKKPTRFFFKNPLKKNNNKTHQKTHSLLFLWKIY